MRLGFGLGFRRVCAHSGDESGARETQSKRAETSGAEQQRTAVQAAETESESEGKRKTRQAQAQAQARKKKRTLKIEPWGSGTFIAGPPRSGITTRSLSCDKGRRGGLSAVLLSRPPDRGGGGAERKRNRRMMVVVRCGDIILRAP